jgi:nucleoside-diphosphate-sugar epimerase
MTMKYLSWADMDTKTIRILKKNNIFQRTIPIKVEPIFQKIKPDSVIHLAAQRPVNDKVDYEQNLKISLSLFETCLKYGVRNIVNISSHFQYKRFIHQKSKGCTGYRSG